MNNFKDRFATDDKHHSFTLTADGCGKRFIDKTPFRDNELMVPKDNTRRSFACRWNHTEFEERTMMNCLAQIEAKGIRDIQPGETVEHFIGRHSEVLI